jgi:hypothetical protein
MASWADTPATKRAAERKERAENLITRVEYHGGQERRGGLGGAKLGEKQQRSGGNNLAWLGIFTGS